MSSFMLVDLGYLFIFVIWNFSFFKIVDFWNLVGLAFG